MIFLEQMEFTNRENKFMKHCGIQITALEEGRCWAELQVEDYCKNTGKPFMAVCFIRWQIVWFQHTAVLWEANV